METSQILTRKVLMNSLGLLTGTTLLIYFQFYLRGSKTGFFCGDPHLSLNFKGDTISNKMSFVSILSATSIIWLVEFFLVLLQTSDNIAKYKEAVLRSVSLSIDYLFGWVLNACFCNFIKKNVSEPRPHFLETCQPDTAENCTKGMYVPNFTCTNSNYSDRFHRSSLTSFPSAHTAFSVYIGCFMVYYIQIRLRKLNAKYFVAVLQMIIMLWPIFCSVSRITDHRHHYWDVCAGLVIGIVMAVFTCIFFCNNFRDLDSIPATTYPQHDPTAEERVTLQDIDYRKDA